MGLSTAKNALSASDYCVPPTFMFRKRRMKAEWLHGSPAGLIGMIFNSNCINRDFSIEWLSPLRNHTKSIKNYPILLVVNNHSWHCSIKPLDIFQRNIVVALTLHARSRHEMKRLDTGFHNMLQKYYTGECETSIRSHLVRAITEYRMTSISPTAYHTTANIHCTVDSFKVTWIWP